MYEIFFRVADGQWAKDKRLAAKVNISLYDNNSLDWMEIHGDKELAFKTLMFMWCTLSERGWSMAGHSLPPDTYTPILSTNKTRADATATQMGNEWHAYVNLENSRNNEKAKKLWYDIQVGLFLVIRCLLSLFDETASRLHPHGAGNCCEGYFRSFVTTKSWKTSTKTSGRIVKRIPTRKPLLLAFRR